jgi:hypothetical protein
MTSTIPFLKPFLMSVESGLLSAENKAHRTTTSPYASAVKSGHHSAYVKIGSVKSRDPSAVRDVVGDKDREIWVRQDVEVKMEPSIEMMPVPVKGERVWEG